MNLLDTGGYSCVYYPPLQCVNKTVSNKYISKLQLEQFAQHEYNIIETLKKDISKLITNYTNYFVLEVTLCKPKQISRKYKNECHLFKNKDVDQHKLVLMNMPHKGTNLFKVIHQNKMTNKIFNFLNGRLIKLYVKAIHIINQQNIYHHDIKSANILLGKDKQCRLIDWGISNIMTYKPYFIFNQPYIYVLLNYDAHLQLQTVGKTREDAREFIISFFEEHKILQTDDYLFTHQILQIIQYSTEKMHPLLVDYYVRVIVENKSIEYMKNIYVHNLDFTGLVTIYMDIIYKVNKQITESPNFNALQEKLISFYLKYMLGEMKEIDNQEFVRDMKALNM